MGPHEAVLQIARFKNRVLRSMARRMLVWSGSPPAPHPNSVTAATPLPGKAIDAKLRILDEGWGHGESLRARRPIDANGDYLPWYTYPAIEYLSQLDLSQARVFEWGAGNSSLYWSKRCSSVVSIESSEAWCADISRAAPDNLTIQHVNEGPLYPGAIASFGKFDIVVIDGQMRCDCVDPAIQHLREGGLIILDNSDWYVTAGKRLRAAGFVQIDFCGFGPVNNYCWATSIYLQRSVRFSPLSSTQPLPPIGSVFAEPKEELELTKS